MEKEKFITYSKVIRILKNNSFYGILAKRVGNKRVSYTFVSYKWHPTTIVVDTLKISLNEKIVLGINVNGKQLGTFKDFIYEMKNLYNNHLKNKKKNYDNTQKYQHSNSRSRNYHNNI